MMVVTTAEGREPQDRRLGGGGGGGEGRRDKTYLVDLLDVLLGQIRRQAHVPSRHVGSRLDRGHDLARVCFTHEPESARGRGERGRWHRGGEWKTRGKSRQGRVASIRGGYARF